MNNVEFFRRETAKKNMGLTKLPAGEETVTIAKNLKPIDFMGMVFETENGYEMVTYIEKSTPDYFTINTTSNKFTYTPETGELSYPL